MAIKQFNVPVSTAVVVPPGGQFAYPSLAPASLKGYLAAYGVHTDILDLNIQCFNDVLSRRNVARLFFQLDQRATEIQKEFEGQHDVPHFVRYMLGLSEQETESFYDIRQKLQETERFCHPTAYYIALQRFSQLALLIDLVYAPVRFLPGSIFNGVFGSVQEIDEILALETPYDWSFSQKIDIVDWQSYCVIGFSAFSFDQVIFAARSVNRIRERNPEAKFVLGGNCLGESYIPDKLKRILIEKFDVVVAGDGELPFLRCVEFALGRIDQSEIPNAYFYEQGALRENAEGYKYQFEHDTRPDFSGTPMDLYPLPGQVLPFRFSNGCEWGKCTFCSESADRGELSSWLAYKEVPEDRVASHISELKEKWGASVFINCSSLVTARGCKIISQAFENKQLNVQWFAMVRAEKAFDEQTLRRCAAGGASAFNFGIESFHPVINRRMKKGVNLRRVPALLKTALEMKITVTLYSLVNFPGETVDQYQYHLEQLEKNFNNIDILFQSVFMLVMEAPIYQNAADYDIRFDQERVDRLLNQTSPVYLLPDDHSGSPAYRQKDDSLDEKLDMYYHFLLRIILKRPLYFDRCFEIASKLPYWEPEYNMLSKQLPDYEVPPAYSLTDLINGQVTLSREVQLEQLENGVWSVALPSQSLVMYYTAFTGQLLWNIHQGASFQGAFQYVVDEMDPSALDVLELYENIHRKLRFLGALEIKVKSLTGSILTRRRESESVC